MNQPKAEVLSDGSDKSDIEAGLQLPEAQLPLVIPVLREEAEIRKQRVTTGTVRIRKVVHHREEVFNESAIHTQIEIERVPMNRAVEEPPPVRHEGETTVYPVVEEILIISKQYLLKEEVRITHRRSETSLQQSVSLLTEEVIVEREETTNAVMSTHKQEH